MVEIKVSKDPWYKTKRLSGSERAVRGKLKSDNCRVNPEQTSEFTEEGNYTSGGARLGEKRNSNEETTADCSGSSIKNSAAMKATSTGGGTDALTWPCATIVMAQSWSGESASGWISL